MGLKTYEELSLEVEEVHFRNYILSSACDVYERNISGNLFVFFLFFFSFSFSISNFCCIIAGIWPFLDTLLSVLLVLMCNSVRIEFEK